MTNLEKAVQNLINNIVAIQNESFMDGKVHYVVNFEDFTILVAEFEMHKLDKCNN